MPLFHRTPLITLNRRLEDIDYGLQRLEQRADYVPSPEEMLAMDQLRRRLSAMSASSIVLEEALWKRAHVWQYTPYTPHEQPLRAVGEWIGWAIIIILVACQIGWIIPSILHLWFTYIVP